MLIQFTLTLDLINFMKCLHYSYKDKKSHKPDTKADKAKLKLLRILSFCNINPLKTNGSTVAHGTG